MDRKVVSINKIHTLEGIANIAAAITMEMDLYVGLGMAVELYLENQTDTNYTAMTKAFNNCIERYPTFHNMRHGQLELLIKNGNMVANKSVDGEAILYEHPPTIEPQIPANVIQFPTDKS
jgi:hypothetical protein